MAIPDYQSVMLPILQLASDGKEHLFRETVETLAKGFALTPEERAQQLPSRTALLFDNRVGWARTYFVKAGLLESPRRAYFHITARGRGILAKPPARLDAAFLKDNYKEFRDFVAPPQDTSAVPAAISGNAPVDVSQAPEESLEASYQSLRRAVESDILARLKSGSSTFFEEVVVRLLVAMGYGGTLGDAGKAIGKSGDGGIDGIIKEDRLGLDVVYVQAKRWKESVGRPEIQKFVGALHGQHARKGVFITTSTFSAEARDFVENIEAKIVLIDGTELTKYMFEHNVGVARAASYEVKKVDMDFFEEADDVV